MLRKTILFMLVGCIFLLFPSLIYSEKHVAVPAAAFHPVTDGEDYRIYAGGHTDHYLCKKLNPGLLIAPVYFPQERGEILAMKVLVQDEKKDGFMEINLFRTRLSTGEAESVFTIWTEYNPGKVIMIDDIPNYDPASNKFDNREYAWYVWVYFYGSAQDLNLYNVQLVYE